jgi:hypothetical protein
MATAHECRQFAEQCMRWARHTTHSEDRDAFLDMARVRSASMCVMCWESTSGLDLADGLREYLE